MWRWKQKTKTKIALKISLTEIQIIRYDGQENQFHVGESYQSRMFFIKFWFYNCNYTLYQQNEISPLDSTDHRPYCLQ